jgi:outer membrane protein insertion porin family
VSLGKLKILGAGAALLLCVQALAFESFVIREIRAEGLERLDVGTVLTYLPLSAGDEISEQTSRQAIRALYGSGLFQDVQLMRDGDALVIVVQERPAITTFSIEGNEKIGGEELKKSLKDLGLADGELFKRELLDQVEQELRRQYYANGYYDVQIDTQVNQEPNNRVNLKIKVTEGKVTHIQGINILGNKAFGSDELLDQFKLEATHWRPFQSSDKYSKQQLGGDLETLQSYYQDRGYLKFNVNSVQVQLTPDKQHIYITINIEEGEVYKVKAFRFTGETVMTAEFLRRLVTVRDGEIFSRKLATESADRIEAALSDIGYAFAQVTPVPEIDEAAREVTINFLVDPGKRAYVRRISFTGHGSTNDETLRREMRQLESAPFSKSSVERSRVRLTRLPFIEEAEVDTRPVPGSDDLVDIVFRVKERPPGSVQFGVGYSGAQGFLLTGQLTHTNFLGTGNRLDVSANNNSISRSFSFGWTDPYFTEDGISRSINLFARETDSIIRLASGLNSNSVGGSLTFGIPLSEYMSLRAGLGIEHTAIQAFPNSSSDQILEFAALNGVKYLDFQARTGVTYDSRNRTFFADRGGLHSLSLDVNVPGSDLQLYTISYRAQQYVPIWRKLFLELNGSIGLVERYGDTLDVPPYQHFFAGGSRTVRGYSDGSLGPRDTFAGIPINPFGGKLRTTMQNELIVPLPMESDGKSTRLSLFYDVGQVFAEPGDFDVGALRQSAGVAFAWFTPFLGLLELSYAFPLDEQPGDRVDRFQITFGPGF